MIPRIVFTFTLRTNILKWINVKGFILVVVTVIRTSSLWAYSYPPCCQILLSTEYSVFCRSVTLLIFAPAHPASCPGLVTAGWATCWWRGPTWRVSERSVQVSCPSNKSVDPHTPAQHPSCLFIVFQHTASYRQPSTCSTDTPSSPMFSTINF